MSILPPKLTDVSTEKKFKDRTPCNWTLSPVEDSEDIFAVNIITGETFEGSMPEFNTLLKG